MFSACFWLLPMHVSSASPVKGHWRYRSGYEVTPKATPYKSYALNNPGTPTQTAFDLSQKKSLNYTTALDPYEWNQVAVESNLLPAGVCVHAFQVEVCNTVLMRRGDCVLISPTGSGKSLTWTLPLAARKEGISLVFTPFTSLGQEGEQLRQTGQIQSIFIYSEQNSQADYKRAAKGEMMVLYVCPETLESPSFARLLHSRSWRQRVSAIYIDEVHLVHESQTWRPSYSRIYQLRNIREAFCASLMTYAGLHPDYHLINLRNFRPELSTMIVPMEHEIQSFLDIAFILPLSCKESDLVKTIVYSFSRAAYMDIIHSDLSSRHQDMALQDFRNGKTSILLGSSRISAGMKFPRVRRVIQYKCRGLTIPGFDQQRDRGDELQASRVGNPGDQDPGMVELVQSMTCAEEIIQRHLENPSDYTRDTSFNCCNRCDPNYRLSKEYKWVEVNFALPESESLSVKTTALQQDTIYSKLIEWRLNHWKKYWRVEWPSYGPKSLVSDSDLEEISKHTSKIHSVDDLKHYTHIVHWTALSGCLFEAVQEIC
ncbi:hypothetical protein B0H19DRAFT_1215090 [Mycena capillaripes]|nr:hypothetical protein B0H19DRAFT_1215090 [Mycena capillaripes]